MKLKKIIGLAAIALSAAMMMPQTSSAQIGKNLINKAKEGRNNYNI